MLRYLVRFLFTNFAQNSCIPAWLWDSPFLEVRNRKRTEGGQLSIILLHCTRILIRFYKIGAEHEYFSMKLHQNVDILLQNCTWRLICTLLLNCFHARQAKSICTLLQSGLLVVFITVALLCHHLCSIVFTITNRLFWPVLTSVWAFWWLLLYKIE